MLAKENASWPLRSSFRDKAAPSTKDRAFEKLLCGALAHESHANHFMTSEIRC
jgi:hypothetical protein